MSCTPGQGLRNESEPGRRGAAMRRPSASVSMTTAASASSNLPANGSKPSWRIGFLVAIEAWFPPGAEQANTEAALIPDWLAWLRRQVAAHDPLYKGVRAVAVNLSSVTSWTYRPRES